MKVLLVNPPRFNRLPVIREDRCENIDKDCVHPPTSLIYIAGVLRDLDFEVIFLDANGLNLSYHTVEDWLSLHKNADWLIFRSTPSTFYWDCKIVEIAKRAHIHTLMLNWNLHHVPDRVKRECPDLDVYLNHYHYEYQIPKIIENFPYFPHSIYEGTYDIPEPAWDLILSFKAYYTRTKWFSPWVVIRGSKGCPFNCNFCIDAKTGWCARSPELIVDEIEYLVSKRGVKRISFYDDTFEVDHNWCLDICEEILRRELNFKWYINSRADLICKRGVEFFRYLKEAGCDGSSIGLEFGSQEMLDASNKELTVEENRRAIEILHEVGIKSYVSCMIGYLWETEEQMIKTRDFIKETNPTGFQINIIVPYNGTELYDEALKEGLIDEVELDWRGLSCIPTEVRYAKLSELELNELVRLRRKFYRDIYFSSWTLINFRRCLGSLNDLKLGFGYFLSGLSRLRRGVEYSH